MEIKINRIAILYPVIVSLIPGLFGAQLFRKSIGIIYRNTKSFGIDRA
jgi:hypothetical protein